MTDRPTARELVEAVHHLLETEVVPALTDARLRFQTLVAANVLGIVGRELATADKDLRVAWRWLSAITGGGDEAPQSDELAQAVRLLNNVLCLHILRGDYDEPERFRTLLNQLRPLVVRKLEIANPRFLASYRIVP
jgi:hypothetical protein